ncbi:MAG: glycosyltransferase family 2 protein [Janthinobacterium lividum]
MSNPDPHGPPEVTVVVPAYNIAAYIDDCMDSILSQHFTDLECWVVDDGSTDATAARVQARTDPRIKLIRQANAGVSEARNAGLAQARGRYVMFLDGDDLLHPQALGRLVASLDAHPAAAATFGTLVKILQDGRLFPGQKALAHHRYPSGNVLAQMIEENFLANGGHVLVRTAAARTVGGFDEALRLSEDWEFWCRLAASGEFIFIGNEPEVFYLRVHQGSAAGIASDWTNHQASLNAVLGNAGLRDRFEAGAWQRLERRVRASHMWEAGRVNFTKRRFAPARHLMVRSLLLHPRGKRVALFMLAQASQILNRPLASRLRFADDD